MRRAEFEEWRGSQRPNRFANNCILGQPIVTLDDGVVRSVV
jgi:hypothetical protein